MDRSSYRAATVTILVFLAASAALSCATGQKAGPAESLAAEIRQDGETRVFRGGRLVVQEGVPLLTISGSPYEMGLQYGVLLRERLNAVSRDIDEFVEAVLSSRNCFERAFAPLAISGYTRDMRKRIPAEFLEEIRGVAEGSGLPEEKLVFFAAGAGVFSQPMENGAPHCTSILARLPDRLIHGRNFDFLPALMGKHPVVVHYRPQSGNGYWNFGVIGYLPSFHGINEKGISVTLNYGPMSYDKKAGGMPAGYKIRRLFREADGMEGARRILKGTPADEPGWIFTVNSAEEGEGAVFDILGAAYAESRFTEPWYKMVLNRMFSPVRYPDGELAKKHLYFSDGEGEYNIARFENGTKHLGNKPLSSVDEILAFLKTTDFYGYEFPFNMNATIANDFTIHTLIFDWKSRRVLFASGVSYAPLHPVRVFNLVNDSLAPYAAADPKLAEPRYAKLVGSMIEFQNHYFAEDRAWIAANTDYAAADPNLVAFNVETWLEDHKVVSKDTLLAAADRLIGRYPDYNMPYALKADLLAEDKPGEAVELYNAALAARINFNPERVVHLAKIAELQEEQGKKVEAAATAARCLAILDEMGKKYLLDEWAVKIRKKMKKLAHD